MRRRRCGATGQQENAVRNTQREAAKAAVPPANRTGAEDTRLASIVDSSDDAIIGIVLSGRVFAWNKAADRLFGYTAEEMIGNPLTIIFPSDRLEEEASILSRLANGERVERYETTRRCKDGRLIRIAATASPICDREGRITGASTIVRDLTERDAHNRRIQELQGELAHVQRLTELGQIVSALVHEINQPITAIKNYLNAVRRLITIGNQAGAQAALERMDEQAGRTSEIVKRIRDYVKKRDVKIQPEVLFDVLEEAVALTRSSIRDNEAVLIVEVDPREQQAEIDRILVQQVIFNLMRNSLEAMQDQPGRQVTISAKRAQDEMIEISVADTGPGLPEEVRKQLFQPFVTTKRNGMGVGLSVCQGIVRLHGGQLWADNNLGGGTIFRFTVKRAGNQGSVAK